MRDTYLAILGIRNQICITRFLVNMHTAFQDRESLYLVMDLMIGGDLRFHICKNRKFNEE